MFTPAQGLTGGRWYFINRTADGYSASAAFSSTATYGVLLEHPRADNAAVGCAMQIVDGARVTAFDRGFLGNSTVTVNAQGMTTGTIVCPECGLTGRIRRDRWEAA